MSRYPGGWWQQRPGRVGWRAREIERLAAEYEEGLEAARRYLRRPRPVYVHNAVRELNALASIEAEAQAERTKLGRSAEEWAAELAEALDFLLGPRP